jgi:hypothetical protein
MSTLTQNPSEQRRILVMYYLRHSRRLSCLSLTGSTNRESVAVDVQLLTSCSYRAAGWFVISWHYHFCQSQVSQKHPVNCSSWCRGLSNRLPG